METISTPPQPPQEPPSAFNKWAHCAKALRALPEEASQEARSVFLDRVLRSPKKKIIAFEILHRLMFTKDLSKLGWLREPMLQELGQGSVEPNLALLPFPKDAGKWVFNEFREVTSPEEWKTFTESGRHLWVLLAILKSYTSGPHLIEALSALGECAEQCEGRMIKKADGGIRRSTRDASSIIKLLRSVTLQKLEFPKGFLEALYAVNATAYVAVETRTALDATLSKLKATEENLTAIQSAKDEADSQIALLKTQLSELQVCLTQTETALSEEKAHATRLEGFNAVAKREVISRVMTSVRQGLSHRLEHIRRYADRENPDRAEILILVAEIEKHLSQTQQSVLL